MTDRTFALMGRTMDEAFKAMERKRDALHFGYHTRLHDETGEHDAGTQVFRFELSAGDQIKFRDRVWRVKSLNEDYGLLELEAIQSK